MLNCRKHILKKVRIIGICGNVQKIQETKCGVRFLLPLQLKFYNIKMHTYSAHVSVNCGTCVLLSGRCVGCCADAVSVVQGKLLFSVRPAIFGSRYLFLWKLFGSFLTVLPLVKCVHFFLCGLSLCLPFKSLLDYCVKLCLGKCFCRLLRLRRRYSLFRGICSALYSLCGITSVGSRGAIFSLVGFGYGCVCFCQYDYLRL